MSSKDKTRQKLVGSMRKTKAVAGIGAVNAAPETAAEDPRPAARTKPVPASKTERAAFAETTVRATDAYQSGRRVWPD